MKDNNVIIVFKIGKWCIRALLAITGIVPLWRCSSGYQHKNGTTTFNGEIIADKTFVVLSDVFGKSDSTAYYKRYSISDADVKTFMALDRHYAKDKSTVFYCDEEREGQNYYLTKHSVIVKISNALPASFRTLGEDYTGYAKDSVRCYFEGVGFRVKDPATLSVIGGRFIKDKYQVYYEQSAVKGAEVNSFRLLNGFYARDAGHAYYFGYHNDVYNGIHEIPCDIASFHTLTYPYSADSSSVFYLYNKINEADTASFSIIGNGFAKDKSHVYSGRGVVKGADPATFVLLPYNEGSEDEYSYSRDKAHVFWKDKMFSVVNIAAFKVLGLGYAADGKQVYYHTHVVKDADPSTFKAYEYSHTGEDAEDAVNKYYEGKKAVAY